MLIRLVVCAYMAAARLVELAYSRRNIEISGPASEGVWSRRTFPLIVGLHSLVIGGTLIFGKRQRLLWLLLLLAVQPLRGWVLLTLGRRWNARGAVAPELPVATIGPYAYVRHPNYSVVAVELLALPLAYRLDRFALVTALTNALLLTIRVRDEEALLFQIDGYAQHFGAKPRFLPFVI